VAISIGQAEEQGNGGGRIDQAVGAFIGLFKGKTLARWW
jgi:hypothetical protein